MLLFQMLKPLADLKKQKQKHRKQNKHLHPRAAE